MKSLKYILVSSIMLFNINAQTITFNEDSTEAAITNNRIYFTFKNNGSLATSNFANQFMQYDNKHIMLNGGFFLSGYSDTTLWANGVAPSSLVEDYQAGKTGSDLGHSKNKIFAVKASDVHFGVEWQNWRNAVEQGAYFYDGDGDGVYDPVDKNNNGRWDTNEDKPDILYDASLFTAYHDGVPASERRWVGVNPLGIEVQQTVFVSKRNTLLDDVVFIRYSILYKGLDNPSEPDSLTEVIFGAFTDTDIGEPSAANDDLSGSDTLLQSGFTYNYSADDDFGVNPPSVFKTIVQGPLVKSNADDVGYNRMGPDLGENIFNGYSNAGLIAYTNYVSGVPPISDPNYAIEARRYSVGLIGMTGNRIDPCDWMFGEVKGDEDCSTVDPLFWYSGDPVTDKGWLNTYPSDYRDLNSTGKFTLRKNEPMDIIVAYTVGRGTDHLNSITVARETVEYIHEEYERNFSTIVGVEEKEIEEVPSKFTLHQNYPNPFNPTTSIEYQVSSSEMVSLKVYDVLGQEVKTLVNEQKAPGSYRVEFDASDFSSGVYIYVLKAGGVRLSAKMLLLK